MGEAFGGSKVRRNDNDPSSQLRPGSSGSGSKDLLASSAAHASSATQKAATPKNGCANNNTSACVAPDSHVPVAMTKPYHREGSSSSSGRGSGGASSSSSQSVTSTAAAVTAAAARRGARVDHDVPGESAAPLANLSPARGFQSPRGIAPRGGRNHDSAGHNVYAFQEFHDGGGAYGGRGDRSTAYPSPSRGVSSNSTSPHAAASGGTMVGGRDSVNDRRVHGEAVGSASQSLGASSRLPPAPVLPRQHPQPRSAANLTAAAASAMASAASGPARTPTHNLFNHGNNSGRQVFSPHLGSNGVGGRRNTPVLKTEPVSDI